MKTDDDDYFVQKKKSNMWPNLMGGTKCKMQQTQRPVLL